MEFIVTNREIEDAIKIHDYYIKGDFSEIDGHYFFFKRELYELDKTTEEYFAEFKKDKKRFVKERKGDFALVDIDSSSGEIFVATDRLGKENIYYSEGTTFVLTNSFWKGVEVINPTEQDINWLAVKELIIHYIIPFHKTIINNYKIVPPAQIAHVLQDEEEFSLTTERYWQMVYTPKETTIQETAKKVYGLYDHTFELLAKKFGSETKFGVGLSGGWDSRLITFFAKKHGLKLVPYCIGEKYLCFPICTNGYRVAKRLAKYFGLSDFCFINYDSESYLKKIAREVQLIPNRASNIEVGCMDKIPEFDIMLNGEHGGVFFGEFDFEPVLRYTSEDMAECLLGLLIAGKKQEMIMSLDDYKELKKDTQQYIDSLGTENRFDIYYRYFYEIKGSKSKNGFFETIYGTKERYSMYLDPDFIDEYLTWDPLFLANRSLQREFFRTYMPELSKIADETTDAPLFWRDASIKNVPIRFAYALKNYIFKSSMRRDKWIHRDKDFKRLLTKATETNREFLLKHFPDLNVKEFHKSNPRAAANLVKVIMVLDALLNCQNSDKEKYILDKYKI
ncbi:MAG: hypothetical protein IJZ44_06950 [Lachnospiraceae bacterium]|nr:hypothetical protein [Lachnospiraceae bacterium]